MGGTEQDGQGGRPSAGIMTGRRVAIAPLDATLLAVAGGILLAWWLPLPLWSLPCALVLLAHRLTRYPAIALLAALWTLSPWQFTAPLPAAVDCRATFYIADFPTRGYPVGSRFVLVTQQAGDCPLKPGDRLSGADFSRRPYRLGEVLHAQVRLKPGDGSRFAQQARLRGRATVRAVVPLNESAPWTVRQRAALASRIDAVFPAAQRAWLRALIIGDRSGLDAEAQNRLRRSGTSHLIAISGLHLALIAGLIYLLLRHLTAALPPRWRGGVQPHTIALQATLLCALTYALLTGAAAPVLRAWLMLAVLTLCWHWPGLGGGRQALKLAALAILLANPWQLGTAGAWLSFAAVAVILYSAPLWRQLRPLWQWPVLQTLITLALLPIGWALFGGISLVSLVANLVLIPWLAPVLALALLALICPPLAPAATWLLDTFLHALAGFAAPAWAYWQPAFQPGTGAALCATMAVICALARLRGREFPLQTETVASPWPLRLLTQPLAWAALALGISLAAVLLPPPDYHAPNGSAVYYHGSKTLVVNAGLRHRNLGRDDAARYLLPELRRHARRPDAIVLTDKGLRQTSALITLLTAYPQTPVYSTLPLPNLPFAVTYCPADNAAGLVFTKTATGCSARFGEVLLP